MSTSKEVQFLAATFGIKLTDWKGSAVDTNALSKQLGSIKAQVEAQQTKLQNLYVNPRIEGNPLQVTIREYIKTTLLNIMTDIELTRKEIAAAQISHATLHIDYLSKEKDKINVKLNEFNDELKKLDEEFKKRTEKASKIQDLRNKLNASYVSTETDVAKLEKTISSIDNPPEIRKDEFSALKDTLANIKIKVEENKTIKFKPNITFKELQFILPETLLTKPVSELLNYENALEGLISTFEVLSKEANQAASSWDGRVKDLFPDYWLISSEFEDIFHEYEKFRAEILENKVSTREEIDAAVKKLDEKCLNTLLNEKNKTDEKLRDSNTEIVKTALNTQKEEWKNSVAERETIRSKALNETQIAQDTFKEYFPVLLELNRYSDFDAKLTEISTLISQSEFTRASELALKFINTLQKEKTPAGLTFMEYYGQHQEFRRNNPLEKLQELGKKAGDIANTAKILGLDLPYSGQGIDLLISNVVGYYSQMEMKDLDFYKKTLEEIKDCIEEDEQFLAKHKDIKTDSGLGLDDIQNTEALLSDKKDELRSATKELNKAQDEYEKALQNVKTSEDKLKQIARTKEKAEETIKDATADAKAKDRAKKLLKALEKAKTETEQEISNNNKTVEISETRIKEKEKACTNIKNDMKEISDKYDAVHDELASKLLEETNPEIADLVKEWKQAFEKLEAHFAGCRKSLEKDNLGYMEQTVFSRALSEQNFCKGIWEATKKSNDNKSALEGTLSKLNDVKDILDEDMNKINDPNTIFSEKQRHVTESKNAVLAQIENLKKIFPKEEYIPAAVLPFTGKETADALSVKLINLSLDKAEDEENILSVIEQCKKDFEALETHITDTNAAVSKQQKEDFQTLIYFRNRLLLETTTRAKIAKDAWATFNAGIEYIRIAFQQIEAQLNQFTDDFLKALAETNQLPAQMKEFEKLEKDLEKIDTSDLQSVTKQFQKLETDITTAKENLNAAVTIKKIYPKNHEELLKKIGEIESQWKSKSFESSMEAISKWKLLFHEYQIQAEMMEGDIQMLVADADHLRKQVKEKETMLAAFPKTLKHFNDTLEGITESKVKNIDDYDANNPKFRKLQELFDKTMLDPKALQDQESMIGAQQDFDARQKKDWEAFLEIFKNKIMPELSAVVKEQLKNPNVDPNEKDSISQYEKDAEKAFDDAKKSGKKGAYEEGRTHLKKIQGILTRLNRFPEGVNAQKLKSLKDISGKWKNALASLQSQIDTLTSKISKEIKEENNPALNDSDVVSIINKFYENLQKSNFDLAIMKLEEAKEKSKTDPNAAKELKKWKEAGLSLVRDCKTLTSSALAQKLTENPFSKVDLGAFNKTLNTIEKSILLYR